MKKLLLFLALAAAGLQGWALDQVDGVYQIGTAQDLIDFATLVNGGTKTANAVLTADINMSGKTYTPIGNDDNRYKGTFDGQGHVINNLVLNNGEYSDQGIFGVVEGATIKNLIAGPNNSIIGKNNVGGLIGITNGVGWVTLENCGNEGYVEATGKGGAAMIGICFNGGRKTKILNCYNTGTIKANTEGAVLTGWFGGSTATAEVKNFYNNGTVTGQEPGKYFYRNGNDNANITFDNVYDNNTTTYTQTDKTVNACNSEWYRWPYDLNFAGTTNTTVWKFVGSVNHPRPIAEAPVSKDGDYYLINDEHDLYWFAKAVNAGHSTYKAKQTADIDFTDYTNKPESGTDEIIHSVMIGWDAEHPFSGEYDGQEYNVQVSYDRTVKNTGLFRNLKNATIKNLCTTGTIKNTASCSGGIFAGTVQEGETGSTVENCLSSVTFDRGETGGDATFGGIGAYMHGSGKIKNCAFLGTISAENADGNGGILGYANGGTNVKVQNCYVNATTISVADDVDNSIIVRNATPENCYYVTNRNLRTQTGAIQVSSENVLSGRLCYLLNGDQSSIKWYQNLIRDVDSNPVPFSSHRLVYLNSTTYSNLVLTDSNYQLGSAEDLNDFSSLVNAGGTTLNAVLTDDIDMAGVTYTPIGTDSHKYGGTFDGQGHRIKYLIIDTDVKEQGLFSVCTNATIKNLIMDASCSIKSTYSAWGNAAFVAVCNGTGTLTFENCGNEASVEGAAGNNAAFLGKNYSSGTGVKTVLTNCYNTGAIKGGSYNAALVGESNGKEVTTTNCYNKGTVERNDGGNTTWINGSGTKNITNCYTTLSGAELGGLTQSYSEGGISNGELCYLLNKSTCYDVKWTQTIGEDSHPIPFNTHGIVNKISSVGYTTQYIGTTDVTIPDGVEAYAGVINGNWLSLREIKGSIHKNDAVILKGTADTYYNFVPTDGAAEAGSNDLQGSDGTVDGSSDIYALANLIPDGESVAVVGFYPTQSSYKIPAGKAYLEGGGGLVKGFTFVFEDDPDGISPLLTSPEEEGQIYNLAGQRIQKMQKGINIVNGRKVLF